MIVNEIKPTLELSNDFDAKSFEVGDLGFIFDILRNKLYSNPILAICREISCNALDAHREVNKDDVPIEITLPNSLEPFYKIKDFGVGMSPERINEIYTKYGSSTKRDTNKLIGNYGIGAKTFFSYSDTATITTIYNGIKYIYTAVIDETKVGKLVKMSEETTTEGNGTEVCIPVKSKDFGEFKTGTEYITRHWKVKPIIKGGSFIYSKLNEILSGTGWKICEQIDYYTNQVKLIIDGIEYPLDLSQINIQHNSILYNIKGDVYFYFNTGEISLSASREAVYLDDKTKKAIKDKIELLKIEIKKDIENKIQNCENLYQANVFKNVELKKIFKTTNSLSIDFKWKNFQLHSTEYFYLKNCYSYTFIKHYRLDRMQRQRTSTIHFSSKNILYYNDLGVDDLTSKELKHLIDDKKTAQLQVIMPEENISYEDLDKIYLFTEMGIKKLSECSITLPKTKIAKTKTFSGEKLLVFKLDKNIFEFKLNSYDEFIKDTSKKIICLLKREELDGKRSIIFNNKNLKSYDFESIISYLKDYEIYGVDSTVSSEKFEKVSKDNTPFDTAVKEIFKNSKIDIFEINYLSSLGYNLDDELEYSGLMPLIDDKNSLFYTFYSKLEEKRKLLKENYKFLQLYKALFYVDADYHTWLKNNKDKLILNKNNDIIAKQYPLLKKIGAYYLNENKKALAEYINLIDEKENRKNQQVLAQDNTTNIIVKTS